jgi:hypothetical protein
VQIQYISLFFISILLILVTENGISQSEWVLKKEENGIKAMTRQIEGSKFVEYKVESIATGSLASCVAVLHDVNSYQELFEDGKEYRLVEKINDAHIITYLHSNLPFPIKDRDGYYNNQFYFFPESQMVKVEVNCLSSYEEKKRVVRLDYCKGSWTFQKINENQVNIIHTFHTDPKGAIPAWIVNKKSVDSPIQTMAAMKRLVSLAKYQEQRFDFIK